MKTTTLSRECGSFVAANLFRDRQERPKIQTLPAITISRQTGARGTAICQRLQEQLQSAKAPDAPDWQLYDRELVHQILSDHNLPSDLARFMPDAAVGEYQSTINELLGRHPSLWSLFEDSVDTIQRLARQGHCIIVGRGGNHVTRAMSHVMRVCIVGSRHTRLRHIVNREHLTVKQTDAILKKEDHARQSFVRKHYNTDVDDPKDYDIMINTDHLEDQQVVEILVQALKTLSK